MIDQPNRFRFGLSRFVVSRSRSSLLAFACSRCPINPEQREQQNPKILSWDVYFQLKKNRCYDTQLTFPCSSTPTLLSPSKVMGVSDFGCRLPLNGNFMGKGCPRSLTTMECLGHLLWELFIISSVCLFFPCNGSTRCDRCYQLRCNICLWPCLSRIFPVTKLESLWRNNDRPKVSGFAATPLPDLLVRPCYLSTSRRFFCVSVVFSHPRLRQ